MKKIPCPICGKENTPNNHAKHMNSHNSDSVCPGCGKPVHGKTYCGLSCASRINANRTGTGKEPHPCAYCQNPTTNDKFCSLICKTESEYKQFVKEWIAGATDYSYNISRHILRWLNENRSGCCELCKNINLQPGEVLTVNQKNGDLKDNSFGNVRLVCGYCKSVLKKI